MTSGFSRALFDVCKLRRRNSCGWPLSRPTHEKFKLLAKRRRCTGLCLCHINLHPSSPTVIARNFFMPTGWLDPGSVSLKHTYIHDTGCLNKKKRRGRLCMSEKTLDMKVMLSDVTILRILGWDFLQKVLWGNFGLQLKKAFFFAVKRWEVIGNKDQNATGETVNAEM